MFGMGFSLLNFKHTTHKTKHTRKPRFICGFPNLACMPIPALRHVYSGFKRNFIYMILAIFRYSLRSLPTAQQR